MKILSGGYKEIIALFLLLTGVAAFAASFVKPDIVDDFHLFYYFSLSSILAGGLYLFEKTRPWALSLSRLLVGSLFIVSGLIKCNDPMGFSFKLEEYFDERSLGAFWAIFHPYSLPLAWLIAVVEVVLGFWVVAGIKLRWVSWILLAMTLFFGWLTFYTAGCNDMQAIAMQKGLTFDKICVTDCGCFGDALKGSIGRSLTPWESFYKDLILLVFVIVIFLERNSFTKEKFESKIVFFSASLLFISIFSGGLFQWWFPVIFSFTVYALMVLFFKLGREFAAALTAILFTAVFAGYTLAYLPIKDFRPYAVGKNIEKQMQIPEGAQPDVFETILTYKNKLTGEVKEFNDKDYPWQDTNWVWVSTSTKIVKEGDKPAITDFSLNDEDGNEVTYDLLQDPTPMIWIISYNIGKSNENAWKDIAAMIDNLYEKGWTIVFITASPKEEVYRVLNDHADKVYIYFADEVVLKTIIRSNPGILLMQQGNILGKWPHRRLPGEDELNKLIIKQ